MKGGWKKYKLGDIYDVSSGLSKAREEFGSGNPFVSFRDIFYNYFLPQNLTELVNTNDKEIKSCSVQKGDIFLTRTSETLHELGMSSVALKDYQRATFNGFAKRLRKKATCNVDIDPVFIAYYLRSRYFRNQIDAVASMTTRASLNTSSINAIEITIPEYKEQVLIGEVLKSLDDKIELNLQTNKTLEEMANALYKHWFVDFGPFKDEKFVEGELGLMPEGWDTKKLREYVDIINGFAFKGTDFIEDGVPVLKIKNVKAGRILLNDLSYVSKEVAQKAIKARVDFKDILITMTGNRLEGTPDTWVGKCSMFLREDEYYLNQRVSKIKIKDLSVMSRYFLSIMLATEDFQKYFITNATSSGGQANISPDLIYDTNIIVPPNELMVKFDSQVSFWFDLIYKNEIESNILKEIRDYLLPKLISGEIRVKDAAKAVKEIA